MRIYYLFWGGSICVIFINSVFSINEVGQWYVFLIIKKNRVY